MVNLTLPRKGDARPGEKASTQQVGETTTSVTDPTDITAAAVPAWIRRRGGDPVIARRRIAALLDDLLDEHLADVIAPHFPDPAPCAGLHDGPCDWWRTCTGLILGVAERDAAGAVHPWRLAA